MCDLINEVIEIKSPSDVSESSSSSSSTISVLNEGAIHEEFNPILNNLILKSFIMGKLRISS